MIRSPLYETPLSEKLSPHTSLLVRSILFLLALLFLIETGTFLGHGMPGNQTMVDRSMQASIVLPTPYPIAVVNHNSSPMRNLAVR